LAAGARFRQVGPLLYCAKDRFFISFGLSEVPNTEGSDEREAIIVQAKKIVDADIEKKRDTPSSNYVPK